MFHQQVFSQLGEGDGLQGMVPSLSRYRWTIASFAGFVERSLSGEDWSLDPGGGIGKMELGIMYLLLTRQSGHVFEVLFKFPSSGEPNGESKLAAVSLLLPDDLHDRIQPTPPGQPTYTPSKGGGQNVLRQNT